MLTSGQGAMGTNWSTGRYVWTWGRTSSLWGWRSTGTGCPGRLWSVLLWRYSRPAWTRSCAACCRWPCFGRRVGLDDPQRSLPTPTILWSPATNLISTATGGLSQKMGLNRTVHYLFLFNSLSLFALQPGWERKRQRVSVCLCVCQREICGGNIVMVSETAVQCLPKHWRSLDHLI